MRAPVDKHLVGAATEFAVDDRAVDESERAVLARLDVRVIARSARVVQHDGVVGSAAKRTHALGRKTVFPLAAAGVGDFKECHDESDLGSERLSEVKVKRPRVSLTTAATVRR